VISMRPRPIETNAIARGGRAITNFPARLPQPQSALALESLEDPYRFDFLGVSMKLRSAISRTRWCSTLRAFSLSSARGSLSSGGSPPRLFYHLKLRAYVVVELN